MPAKPLPAFLRLVSTRNFLETQRSIYSNIAPLIARLSLGESPEVLLADAEALDSASLYSMRTVISEFNARRERFMHGVMARMMMDRERQRLTE